MSNTTLTVTRKIEQLRKVLGNASSMARVWETTVGLTKFIEERMNHRVDRRKALGRGVLEQERDEIDRF